MVNFQYNRLKEFFDKEFAERLAQRGKRGWWVGYPCCLQRYRRKGIFGLICSNPIFEQLKCRTNGMFSIVKLLNNVDDFVWDIASDHRILRWFLLKCGCTQGHHSGGREGLFCFSNKFRHFFFKFKYFNLCAPFGYIHFFPFLQFNGFTYIPSNILRKDSNPGPLGCKSSPLTARPKPISLFLTRVKYCSKNCRG